MSLSSISHRLISAHCRCPESELSSDATRRLTESAAIMACSENDMHRQLALKIASQIVSVAGKENPALSAASELLFIRLWEFPDIASTSGRIQHT